VDILRLSVSELARPVSLSRDSLREGWLAIRSSLTVHASVKSTFALRATVDNLRMACQPSLTLVVRRERRLVPVRGFEPRSRG
jgi:hypothetical protein